MLSNLRSGHEWTSVYDIVEVSQYIIMRNSSVGEKKGSRMTYATVGN